MSTFNARSKFRANDSNGEGAVAEIVESGTAGRRHGGRYVYEELRKQILTLQLRPGSPLDEVSLAAQFGLSRSPVRDALARLISEGLVTILPNNRTTLVAPFEIKEFPKYISALDLIQRAVTKLAALHRTDADIRAIRKADEVYMNAITGGDYQAMSETNKALHVAIAQAANNPYFVGYYERLLGEGQRLAHLHYDFTVNNPEAVQLGRDHDDIIDAIERRDADIAEALAHEHTMLFQRRFLEYMNQNMTAGMAVL